MTTYTKETALYNTDAIGDGIDGAGETATNYITSVTNDGIMVADVNKGASSGSITSSTTGWHIGGVLEFIRNGVSRFWIGLKNQGDATPTVRIGKAYVANANDNESYMELDYHSLQLIDKEGVAYFHVSDLRDSSGWATISETFYPETATRSFNMHFGVRSVATTSATVNGTAASISGVSSSSVTLSSNAAAGSTVVITYQTASAYAKAYTFGKRDASGSVGPFSVAEGIDTIASGYYSHTEGQDTEANGNSSHAEGASSTASGDMSHAEGGGSVASENCAHAEGLATTASGRNSHAEGDNTHATRAASHAEGSGTTASGKYSHAQNLSTIAQCKSQTTLGEYNIADTDGSNPTLRGSYAVIIGNGTSNSARSNAATIGWDGNYLAQAMAGVIQMFAGPASQTVDNGIVTATGAPNGWLICDGSAVSRTTYATLFAVIGTTYGTGDGSTTFNLPDLQGRVAIGAGSGTGLTSRTLGATGGSESLQSHDHNVASNGYNVPGKSGGWNWRTTGSGSSDNYKNTPMGGSSASVASIAKTGSAGSGNAGNMQPFTVVHYIICTGKTS